MIYLLTPEVNAVQMARFPNPMQTTFGVEEIRNLLKRIVVFHLILTGTGARHMQIAILAQNQRRPTVVPIHYSPFCGTADFFMADGKVLLADGTKVSDVGYFSTNSEWILASRFLNSIADHTLLCADPHIISNLGFITEVKPGIHLYALDKNNGTAKFVA